MARAGLANMAAAWRSSLRPRHLALGAGLAAASFAVSQPCLQRQRPAAVAASTSDRPAEAHARSQPSRPGLTRVSYVSTLRGDAREAALELERVASCSARHNLKAGISGHLCYDEELQRVWQVIEGPPEALGPLWHRISSDPRHSLDEDTVVVEFAEERRYPLGWGMRYSSFARLGADPADPASHQEAAEVDRLGPLVQLSYRSAVAGEGSAARQALEAILARSVVKNARSGITGWLLFDARASTVYQVLEGPPADVDRLWEVIRRDPRHHVDFRSVTRKTIERREFPDWSMAVDLVERPHWTWARAHEHTQALSALAGGSQPGDDDDS